MSGFILLRADDPTKVSVPNVFEYVAPAGWHIVNIPNGQYPAAEEKTGDEIKGLITVDMDTAPGALDQWCTLSIAKNTRVFDDYSPTFGPLTPFTTAGGVEGYTSSLQVTVNGRKLNFIYYFFAGSNNARFAVTCSCRTTDAAHYDPIFEKAAKTFDPH